MRHLAAASSAGTTLVANLKHITVTLATWDAVWEVHLDPKWPRHRLRLYGAQDRALEQFFKKVVCRPRGSDQLRGRVVLVDELRITRVSSAVNGQQPCEEELDHELPTRRADWKPPAGQVDLRLLRPAWSQQPKRSKRTEAEQEAAEQEEAEAAKPTQHTKGKGKVQDKAAKAKPAPQPSGWLDRDCNAALNMQRIGESRWRPSELCYWPDQGALPVQSKEYPGLRYKWLRDKPPKAQQQQLAEAHVDLGACEAPRYLLPTSIHDEPIPHLIGCVCRHEPDGKRKQDYEPNVERQQDHEWYQEQQRHQACGEVRRRATPAGHQDIDAKELLSGYHAHDKQHDQDCQHGQHDQGSQHDNGKQHDQDEQHDKDRCVGTGRHLLATNMTMMPKNGSMGNMTKPGNMTRTAPKRSLLELLAAAVVGRA
ncbi:hypothetical protein QJQ45_017064 [Haematococcus lacustris]|nr:hypothetical protein QJQ45_017064 [Haematococcus lacustris]